MVPHVFGRGTFIEQGTKRYAAFTIKGAYTRAWHNPEPVRLLHVDVYGASGALGADELGDPSHFIRTELVTLGRRTWSLGPRAWPHDKTEWTVGQPYSLLFRHVYSVGNGPTPPQYIVDLVGMFPWVTSTPSIAGVFPPANPTGGDTISSVTLSGSFTIGPPGGLSLYDVSLTYAPPGSARIEIFAAPADPVTGNAPMDLIPTDPYPNSQSSPYFVYSDMTVAPAADWTGTNMSGSYNGADKYFVGIRVTVGSDPPAKRVGTIKNIQAQQADPMEP